MTADPNLIIDAPNEKLRVICERFHHNAFHIACREENKDAIKYILGSICDVSWIADVYGSFENAEERSVHLLKATLNATSKSLNTPLHYACRRGNIRIAELLLSYKECKRGEKNKLVNL